MVAATAITDIVLVQNGPPRKKTAKSSSTTNVSYNELQKMYDSLLINHERVGQAFQNQQQQNQELEEELEEKEKESEQKHR